MFDQILGTDEVFEMKNPSGSIQNIFVIAFIGILNGSLIFNPNKKTAQTKLLEIIPKELPNPFLLVNCDACSFTFHSKEYLKLHTT